MQTTTQDNPVPNMLRFIVVMTAFMIVWYYLHPKQKPEVDEPESPRMPSLTREQAAAGTSPAILGGKPFQDLLAGLPSPAPAAAVAPVKSLPSEPHSLIALGDDSFALKIVLTNHGAGVQQLLLTKFKESNRHGQKSRDANNSERPLHLIPGFQRPNYLFLNEPEFPEHDYPAIVPNLTSANLARGERPLPIANAETLAPASYTLLHYPSRDDPARLPFVDRDTKSKIDTDKYPLPLLGERFWKVSSIQQPETGPWVVVFETELQSPYFLKLRKTFSLERQDYDFKMKIELIPTADRVKGMGKFRYQVKGPLGTPIEGEWYAAGYRTLYMSWLDGAGVPRREVDDTTNIHFRAGSDPIIRPGRFTFAAIGTQFFASALAVDDDDVDDQSQPWEYVRGTRELPPMNIDTPGKLRHPYENDRYFLFDMTFRAVSKVFDPASGESIVHTYSSYNGPLKVRLLEQLKGEKAVNAESVDRYLNKYHLATMTDFHTPNWFGRQFNAIGWTWLLIKTTNFMHWLLGVLHSVVGHWGVSITLLTVLVRLCLFVPSRRQQTINAHMSARIAALKPQIDKLNERYKDDFLAQAQAKRELFREAGISQFAQMGGCLLLIMQMPILMGLYFCLQESVFFRLEEFLWIPNLAAPDMLAWWSESIPMISTPWSRYGGLGFLYMGPYFNLLPLAAVALFYVQQKLTMPPPTDEIQEQQQAMMKYMFIFTGLLFYKMAAGMCVYFIVSGLWSLLERRLVPKPDLTLAEAVAQSRSDPDAPVSTPPAPPSSGGGFWDKMKERLEEAQRQAESRRQIRNTDSNGNNPANNPPKPNAAERAQNRKNKKKRK